MKHQEFTWLTWEEPLPSLPLPAPVPSCSSIVSAWLSEMLSEEMSSTLFPFLSGVGMRQWSVVPRQCHLLVSRKSVFISKADSQLVGIFDESVLLFTDISYWLTYFRLVQASVFAPKPYILLRLYTWACAHLRWHRASLSIALYERVSGGSLSRKASFVLFFEMVSLNQLGSVPFSGSWAWTELSSMPKGCLTDKQGNIQGTLKVMKSKVILDKLWNILPWDNTRGTCWLGLKNM